MGMSFPFIGDLNVFGLKVLPNPASGLDKAMDYNFCVQCAQKIENHVPLGSRERDLIYGHLWDKFYIKYFICTILF